VIQACQNNVVNIFFNAHINSLGRLIEEKDCRIVHQPPRNKITEGGREKGGFTLIRKIKDTSKAARARSKGAV
jgi:hypothetical protein